MKPQDWIDPFAKADSAPPQTLAAFFGWALKGTWAPIGLGAIIAASGGVLEVLAAVVLGLIIDAALAAGPAAFFAQNTGLFVLGVVFFVVVRPINFGLNAYVQTVILQPNLLNLTLSRIHRYTMGQSVTFFDNDFAGRIAQKEMQAATALNDIVVETIQTVIFATASVIGALWMVTAIDWRIGVPLALWLIGYCFFLRYYIPRVRARAKARAEARANVTGQIVDTVTNIKTVKLFAHAEHEDRAALGAMGQYRDRFIAFGKLAAGFRFWLMILAGIIPVALVGAALFVWNQGLVSAGEIAATGTVGIRLAQMTGWVSFTLMQIYANVGELEDGIRTLTVADRIEDAPDAKPLTVRAGEVVFDELTFAYGREKGGIDSVSLQIAPGEKVGVVGASGAGKTTLVSLLLGLYRPEGGRVFIDGQDTASVTQDSLRQQIGMVTQETAMFNRPARDNIRYGNPNATDAQVVKAAQRAEADDFIADLRDHMGRQGYEAFLGERGVKLSGGQRQRIALARAILKDAPILVLDEATSALDSEVEASIQAALEHVMQGKTVLAIAHRLSTLSEMDRIIVMEDGRIAEEGAHDALLAKNGLYARFWNRQSGGFIRTEAAE